MPFFPPLDGRFSKATPTKNGCFHPGVIANSIKLRPLPLRGGGFFALRAPLRLLMAGGRMRQNALNCVFLRQKP